MQTGNADESPSRSSTIQPPPLPSTNMRKDLSKQLVVCGSLQIGFGVVCLILQAVGLGIMNSNRLITLDVVGCGIWMGIIFAIAGSCGIVGSVLQSRCFVISFNVLSIISVSLVSVLIGLSVTSAVYFGSDQRSYITGAQIAGMAVESLMTIAAVAEGIVAIVSSVVCCRLGGCCCDCGGECCCCPAYPAVSQSAEAGHSFFAQPVPGQQQPIIICGSNHLQPTTMTNQQPMCYTLPNGQQLIMIPSFHQEIVQEVTSDRAHLI